MANFSQDTVVPIPANEVFSWVKSYQIGIYTETVLATMVTYDAGEYPKKHVFVFVFEWLSQCSACTFDKEVSTRLTIPDH